MLLKTFSQWGIPKDHCSNRVCFQNLFHKESTFERHSISLIFWYTLFFLKEKSDFRDFLSKKYCPMTLYSKKNTFEALTKTKLLLGTLWRRRSGEWFEKYFTKKEYFGERILGGVLWGLSNVISISTTSLGNTVY